MIRKLIILLTLSAFLTACAVLSVADRGGKKIIIQGETTPYSDDLMESANVESYYHFILGYQAELSNDDETALKEYQRGVET